VQRIFLEVADRPPAERPGLLHALCGADAALRAEVESLLRADLTSETALTGAVGAAIQEEAASILEAPRPEGSRVGPYCLIRELGRGGMGSVYLATRDDDPPGGEVALKLVRPGFDTDFILRRFRRERQILARLHHPNIARLLDSGSAENQVPYLVMEYVEGSTITRHAALNRLSVNDRVRLFLPVCAAVEYAHRAFVIHRDLKPGNILVDRSGAPKLLDFGISKLLLVGPRESGETQDIAMATPDYACPEQIVGDPVTAASDVYSLGAVLYELLTAGARPHRIEQVTPLAIERAICLEPIVPPSEAVRANHALARRLRGDLDRIVLCAMRKEPERRYASAGQLAEDLRRYLSRHPIAAAPDSAFYRAGKFLRRHEASAAAALASSAALIALAAFAIHQERSTAAEERASAVELAAAYGRLALLEGPTDQALRDYAATRELRRRIWVNDPNGAEAIRGYATAQIAYALSIPAARAAEKRAALQETTDWLNSAALHRPDLPELRRQFGAVAAALAALQEGTTKR
jgi:hypothetical protein